MKNIIHLSILLFLFFASNKGIASKRDSVKNHYISLNVTDPLFRIFTKNRIDTNAQSITAPIVFVGHVHKKYITRVGFSGSNTNTASQSALFSDKKSESIYKFRSIMSLYKFKNLNAKWQIQYGINATGLIYWVDQVFDSGFDKVNIYNRSYGAGIGPGLLFQYQVNNRIRLSSEYMILYQYIHTDEGKRFSAFPNENYSKQKITQLGFQFEYPIALYLQYKF